MVSTSAHSPQLGGSAVPKHVPPGAHSVCPACRALCSGPKHLVRTPPRNSSSRARRRCFLPHHPNPCVCVCAACAALRSGPKHLALTMTRAQLDALVKDLLERTRKPCEACLKDAGGRGSSSEVPQDGPGGRVTPTPGCTPGSSTLAHLPVPVEAATCRVCARPHALQCR